MRIRSPLALRQCGDDLLATLHKNHDDCSTREDVQKLVDRSSRRRFNSLRLGGVAFIETSNARRQQSECAIGGARRVQAS